MKRGILTVPILFTILLLPVQWVHAEWTITTVPSPNPQQSTTLCKIDFIDPTEGWALDCYGPALFHYSNGTWMSSQLPDVNPGYYRQLSDIQFISRDEGWTLGTLHKYGAPDSQQGVLLHYSNGGWAGVTLPDISPNWSLSSIHFFSSNEGLAVGMDLLNQEIILLRYTNGEWKSDAAIAVQPISTTIGSVFFTSSNEGWVAGIHYQRPGKQGFILHYLNGELKTSKLPPILNWDLRDIRFVSPDEGWAVGLRYAGYRHSKGVLLHYLNGRWKSVTPPEVGSDWYLNGVDFISPDEGWAVGGSTVLHYVNGSWTTVSIPGLDNFLGSIFTDVQFTSPNQGWISGYVITARSHVDSIDLTEGLLIKYSSP